MPIMEKMPGASTMPDKTVAFDMLKESEFCLMSLTKAAMEAVNPEFRQVINQSLQECIQEHFIITDIIVAKGWAHPYGIQQQLAADLQMAQMMTTTMQQ